jgi:hypothetical protein
MLDRSSTDTHEQHAGAPVMLLGARYSEQTARGGPFRRNPLDLSSRVKLQPGGAGIGGRLVQSLVGFG